MSKSTNSKTYNFCGKRKLILILAVAVILVTVIGIIVRGVNLAIEFKGGTLITYNCVNDIDTNEAEKIIEDVVNTSVKIRTGENIDSNGKLLTVSFTSKSGLTVDRQAELTAAFQEAFPDAEISLYDSNDVNPTTGKEFLLKSLIAVIFAAILIIIYVAIRFSKIGGWTAGVCSIFALILDLMVAFATTVICGFEINSNTVAVLLTILGYSINNTIVIYDRIRENKLLMPKASTNDIINAGCSQSLTRSIRTSITTIGTMLIITIVVLIKGYTSLLSFSVPLMFGLISGTYSSLFVAPVTWSAWLEKRAKKSKKK